MSAFGRFLKFFPYSSNERMAAVLEACGIVLGRQFLHLGSSSFPVTDISSQSVTIDLKAEAAQRVPIKLP